MMETITRNITDYLVRKKLVTRARLVDGGLAIALGRHRNRSIRVKQAGWPSLFLKQAIAGEHAAQTTIAREAAVYEGAFGDDRLAALRDFLPRFHFYDADEHLLVTDLVAEAESVTEFHAVAKSCPPTLAARMGEALGRCHSIRFAEGAPQAAIFPMKPPWIFDFHARDDVDWMRRSEIASLVIDIIRDDDALRDRLSVLRRDWCHTTLIHTDIKWDNYLFSPRGAALDDRKVHIIDWELADIGDPAWDLGSLFHSYILHWLRSMPDDAGTEADAFAEAAGTPLAALQPAIVAAWEGYRSQGTGDRLTDVFLDRSVAMAGARMLVSAYEIAARATILDPRMLLLLQAASNILARPADARRHLLGLES